MLSTSSLVFFNVENIAVALGKTLPLKKRLLFSESFKLSARITNVLFFITHFITKSFYSKNFEHFKSRQPNISSEVHKKLIQLYNSEQFPYTLL